MNPTSVVMTRIIHDELISLGLGARAWTASRHSKYGAILSSFALCFRGNRPWQSRIQCLEWPVFANARLIECGCSGINQVSMISAFWEKGGGGGDKAVVYEPIVDPDEGEHDAVLGDGDLDNVIVTRSQIQK